MFDTICAIASGNVNQAISIIRIVGPEALAISRRIFTGQTGAHKTLAYGFIVDPQGHKLDEVLVSFQLGRDNFVGEDTVEINAHGGIVVTNRILELILAQGARLASPGEFTRRAYLNGKITLLKAEAINELIHAKTAKQHELALSGFDGARTAAIGRFGAELERLIGLCEVNIDYPEYEDIPLLANAEFNTAVATLAQQLAELIQNSEANLVYTQPLKVALVGRPNAGKSALLNALSNAERAIVTATAGTTRDIIEADITFNNMVLRFQDTAGIRAATGDEIERIGITKSWQALRAADVVFHVIDATAGWHPDDEQIQTQCQNIRYLQLWNKADQVNKRKAGRIYISALQRDLSALETALTQLFQTSDLNATMVFNPRQTTCLKKAQTALRSAQEGIAQGLGYDVVITDLHECWMALQELTGAADKEALLDSIFKNFCLGK